MTNQTNRPDETHDAELDGALRKMVRETHPRPAFVAKLRGELETQAAHPRRDFWSLLNLARPWLTQAVLIAALAALVLVAGNLAGRLFAPDGDEVGEVGANQTPSAAENVSLPANALARLGKGKITSIDAAPDGRIAVGSTAGLCMYNTGLSTDWCRWTDAPVHEVLFDPTGTRLAVHYGTENLVEIWDAAQGQVIASREFTVPLTYTSPSLPNPNFFIVKGLAWEPQGSRIAVLETGQGVSVWDWQNDAIAWGPVTVGGEPIGVEWINGPEGESIVSALTLESLTLVNGSTGQAMTMLSDLAGAAPGTFLTLARAAQGSRIAVGSEDKISVFDLAAWNVNLYQSIPHPAGRYYGIALSVDGEHVAALTNDAQIITFDLRTGQEMARLPAMALTPLEWNPADGRLYYTSPDGSLASFDGRLEGAVIVSGHTLAPQFAAWRDDGTVITAADNFIYTWDAATQTLASFSEMTLSRQVMAAGLSKDGTRALFFEASASDVVNAARIIVWDVVNNQPLQDIEVGRYVLAVTLSPDGTRLAAVHGSGQIFTWKLLDNGAEQRDLTGITGFMSVEALAFHPDGEQIAVAYTKDDGSPALEVHDIVSQQKITDLALGDDIDSQLQISNLAWSEDGKYLGASQGWLTAIWETSTLSRQSLYEPQVGSQSLRAFAFNGVLGYASAERDVLYYSLKGEAPRFFSGHAMSVNNLAFRPDGEVLASASSDGTVILWNLESASLPPVEVRPTETPLPVDSPTTTVQPPQGYQEYTVVAGDTCGGIAFTFGISVDSLIALNNLSPKCDNLYVGQVLRVPYPTPTPQSNYTDPTLPAWQEYVVMEGDTCLRIALNFNTSIDSLIAFNGLASNCEVYVGQKLLIPYPTPTPFPTNTLDPNPSPMVPTETPPPTRTTVPGQPAPLPNATQRPIPDTTGYDVSQTSGISPSGKWTFIAIRGEWTANAPREEDLNFILVDSVDGPENWVLEEYTPHGLGEGKPTGFTFSADDRYLYFYDSGTPDGCGLPWQAVLRRLDLQSGIVSLVPPTLHLNGYDEYALSPNASRLAVVTHSGIVIYGMDVLQPQQVITLPFIDSVDWTMTDIHWQPTSNSTLLAFEIVSPPEDPCNTPPADQKRWTVVIDTDEETAWNYLNPPGTMLHTWSDFREGGIYGRLIYQSQDGSELQVDPRSGEVINE